jgi:hypothetical protein
MALKTTLTAWNRRALSFCGRGLIVNMLGLSTLWFLCSFFVMPEEIIKAVSGRFSVCMTEETRMAGSLLCHPTT